MYNILPECGCGFIVYLIGIMNLTNKLDHPCFSRSDVESLEVSSMTMHSLCMLYAHAHRHVTVWHLLLLLS